MSAMAHAHPRGRGFTRNVLLSAMRGGALIGLAVIIGILLLQVVDDSGPGGFGSPGPTPTTRKRTTSTTNPSKARDPAEVAVQVLNGSQLTGAAGSMSNTLKSQGYQVPLAAGNAAIRTGTVVQCKSGFEAEGAELVEILQDAAGVTATTDAFPNPAPAGTDVIDCLVVLGK